MLYLRTELGPSHQFGSRLHSWSKSLLIRWRGIKAAAFFHREMAPSGELDSFPRFGGYSANTECCFCTRCYLATTILTTELTRQCCQVEHVNKSIVCFVEQNR